MGVAQFFDHIDIAPHFIFERAIKQSGFLIDEILFVSRDQLLIETVPAKCAAGFDDVLKTASFLFAVNNRFTSAEIASHDLGDEMAAAASFGY